MAVQVAYLNSYRVARDGSVLGRDSGPATIKEHLNFTTETRIAPDSANPTTADYPQLQKYLNDELAAGRRLVHLGGNVVVTST